MLSTGRNVVSFKLQEKNTNLTTTEIWPGSESGQDYKPIFVAGVFLIT